LDLSGEPLDDNSAQHQIQVSFEENLHVANVSDNWVVQEDPSLNYHQIAWMLLFGLEQSFVIKNVINGSRDILSILKLFDGSLKQWPVNGFIIIKVMSQKQFLLLLSLFLSFNRNQEVLLLKHCHTEINISELILKPFGDKRLSGRRTSADSYYYCLPPAYRFNNSLLLKLRRGLNLGLKLTQI
jgi:hypothetical protein